MPAPYSPNTSPESGDPDFYADQAVLAQFVADATDAATASVPMLRDSNGRAKVVSPSTSDDSTLIATTAFVQAVVAAAISGLVDSAPGALDTLQELAAALGDDADFAGTVTTALAGKAPIRQTINAQTGTTYTPVLSDENKLVTLTNAGAITVTLPQDSALAFPVGGVIDFAVLGAGMATFSAGAGATVHATPSAVTLDQYSGVRVQKIAANTWWVVGRLETP